MGSTPSRGTIVGSLFGRKNKYKVYCPQAEVVEKHQDSIDPAHQAIQSFLTAAYKSYFESALWAANGGLPREATFYIKKRKK